MKQDSNTVHEILYKEIDMLFLNFDREIKKVKETKKIFDKMGYDLSKYDHSLIMISSGLLFVNLWNMITSKIFFSALVRNSQLPKSSKTTETEEASIVSIKFNYLY